MALTSYPPSVSRGQPTPVSGLVTSSSPPPHDHPPPRPVLHHRAVRCEPPHAVAPRMCAGARDQRGGCSHAGATLRHGVSAAATARAQPRNPSAARTGVCALQQHLRGVEVQSEVGVVCLTPQKPGGRNGLRVGGLPAVSCEIGRWQGEYHGTEESVRVSWPPQRQQTAAHTLHQRHVLAAAYCSCCGRVGRFNQSKSHQLSTEPAAAMAHCKRLDYCSAWWPAV